MILIFKNDLHVLDSIAVCVFVTLISNAVAVHVLLTGVRCGATVILEECNQKQKHRNRF